MKFHISIVIVVLICKSVLCLALDIESINSKLKSNGFSNPQTTLIKGSELYSSLNYSKAQNFFNLSLVLIRGTNWTTEQVHEHLREVARTYVQPNCQIYLKEVYLVEVDPYKGFLDIDWSSIYLAPSNARDVQIAKQIPEELPRPVAVFMRSSAQGSSAWANPKHRIRPEIKPLLNFTFVMSMVNTNSYKAKVPENYNPLAHELAHLFVDVGHNDFAEPNILSDDFAKINDVLLPEQCQRVLKSEMVFASPML